MDVGDSACDPVTQLVFWLYWPVLFCSLLSSFLPCRRRRALEFVIMQITWVSIVWPLPIYNLTLSKGICFYSFQIHVRTSQRVHCRQCFYIPTASRSFLLVRMPKPKLCIRVYDKPVHQHHIHCSTKEDKSKRKTKQIFLFVFFKHSFAADAGGHLDSIIKLGVSTEEVYL